MILKKIIWNLVFYYWYRKYRGDIKKVFIDNVVHSESYEHEVIGALLDSYYQQKEIQKMVPLVYQPGAAWEKEINTRRGEWLKALQRKDIPKISGLLANFFRNSGLAGLQALAYFEQIEKASLITKVRYTAEILIFYDLWRNLVNADIKELEMPQIGNPWGYMLKQVLVNSNSFRHHYYASRLNNLLENIDRPVICEIGGGYGGTAYFLMKKEKNICYINFDLPEILLIISYFISCAFPEKKILLFTKDMYGKSFTNMDSFDVILMPNYMLPFLPELSVDVTINTNSLSEMNYDIIKEYIGKITRFTRKYFYHCNSDIPGLLCDGKFEIKASDFPMDNNKWKNIYRYFHPFFTQGRYSNNKEFLYERID